MLPGSAPRPGIPFSTEGSPQTNVFSYITVIVCLHGCLESGQVHFTDDLTFFFLKRGFNAKDPSPAVVYLSDPFTCNKEKHGKLNLLCKYSLMIFLLQLYKNWTRKKRS